MKQLHRMRRKYFPKSHTALLQFLCKFSFRFFFVKLLQGRGRGQWIKKICIKGQPCPFIYKLIITPIGINQSIKALQQLCIHKHRTRINVYILSAVYSPCFLQHLYGLFM